MPPLPDKGEIMFKQAKKPTKESNPVKVVEESSATTLMKKNISNLTDIVSQLQHDVKRIKIRMGL